MLLWFVDREVATAALGGKKLIGEEEVETRPEQVSASCLDENICIQTIQTFFTPDAWAAVVQVCDMMKQRAVWYCGACTRSINDDTQDSTVCEACLILIVLVSDLSPNLESGSVIFVTVFLMRSENALIVAHILYSFFLCLVVGTCTVL